MFPSRVRSSFDHELCCVQVPSIFGEFHHNENYSLRCHRLQNVRAEKCPHKPAKQDTFWSYNKSIFYIVRLDGNPFVPVRKGKQKRLKNFKFHTFIGRFQVTAWQWKGYLDSFYFILFFTPYSVQLELSEDFDVWHLRTLFCGRMEVSAVTEGSFMAVWASPRSNRK